MPSTVISSRSICGLEADRPNESHNAASAADFKSSRRCMQSTPPSVGQQNKDDSQGKRGPAANGPYPLAGHETARQHVDALQKPNGPENNQEHAQNRSEEHTS